MRALADLWSLPGWWLIADSGALWLLCCGWCCVIRPAGVATSQGAQVLQQLGALGSTILADSGSSGTRTEVKSIQAEIDHLLELCGGALKGPLGDATQAIREFLYSLSTG